MNVKKPHSIDTDWYDQPLSPPAQISIYQKDGGLFLHASREDSCQPHPLAQPSQFYEGLWKFDVAEAFFFEPESNRYLEVNLAPSGSWWACWHSGIRQREAQQPSFQGVRASGTVESSRWEASLFLPDSLFSEIKTLRFNATFILNSPAQTFHSLAKLTGEQPDFHQPQHFVPLQLGVPA